jgi:hypothetical protein
MPHLSFCIGKYTVACTTALLFVSSTYAAKFCSVKTRGSCLWKVLPALYPADTPVNFRFTSYSQSLVLRNTLPSRQPHWPTGTVAVSTHSVLRCCCSVGHSAYGNFFPLFFGRNFVLAFRSRYYVLSFSRIITAYHTCESFLAGVVSFRPYVPFSVVLQSVVHICSSDWFRVSTPSHYRLPSAAVAALL